MVIVGCDPGLDGALALIREGQLADLIDIPVTERDGKHRLAFNQDGDPEERVGVVREINQVAVKDKLSAWMMVDGPGLLVMEKVWVRPNQGAVSAAKLLRVATLIEGIATGLGMGTTLVAPATWKAAMGVSDNKTTSLDKIRSLAPADMLHLFKLKKHHNRAEAVLIGLWGWKTYSIVS